MTNIATLSKQAETVAEDTRALADSLRQIAETPAVETTNASGDPFIFSLTIFILACFVGYYVVWKVTPALHTPLMSVTNAISGVIIVGAMLAAGSFMWEIGSALGLVAVFLASINIFGGFIVTTRMLSMFKKK
jgi:H+-translocating NAD(P) transhydrogenase subunit alpha